MMCMDWTVLIGVAAVVLVPALLVIRIVWLEGD